MSHSVTIHRTVTSSANTTSYMIINTGYCKTFPGILKTFELILGAVCVGLIAYFFNGRQYHPWQDLFFFLMSTTFLIGTFCIVLSSLTSLNTASILYKLNFEHIYHSFAFALLLSASIMELIVINERSSFFGDKNKRDCYQAAGYISLVNSILYLISAILPKICHR